MFFNVHSTVPVIFSSCVQKGTKRVQKGKNKKGIFFECAVYPFIKRAVTFFLSYSRKEFLPCLLYYELKKTHIIFISYLLVAVQSGGRWRNIDILICLFNRSYPPTTTTIEIREF